MSLHVKCESRKVSLPSPRIENLEKVVQVGFERGYISLGRSFTITWRCGCMQQASPNQYRYKIREQSCATVSSVAVARQGAQCGARLHRWIKVRSAGHDIPRSTRSMKVGTNNFASGKSKRARYVQKFSLLSPPAFLAFSPEYLHVRYIVSIIHGTETSGKLPFQHLSRVIASRIDSWSETLLFFYLFSLLVWSARCTRTF